jgi:hypothetical protein
MSALLLKHSNFELHCKYVNLWRHPGQVSAIPPFAFKDSPLFKYYRSGWLQPRPPFVHLYKQIYSRHNNRIRSLNQLLPCHSDSIWWCEIQVWKVWSSSMKGLNTCSALKFINYYLQKLLLHMHINAHSNSIKTLYSSSFQRISINPYDDADIQ